MAARETPRALFGRWLPTAVGTALLITELPLVTVSAARSAEPGQTLAALGISMSLLVIVNAPALAVAGLVVISPDVDDRRLSRYAFLVGAASALVLAVVALAPPLLAGLQWGLGLDDSVTSAVRWCLIGLIPNPLGVALRRNLHGRLIRARRTRPIAPATLVRIAASAGLAALGVSMFPHHGAGAAGLALSVGALTEFAILAAVVRRLPFLPRPAGPRVSSRALVRRHRQLSSAWLLNNLPAMATTVGIAHATESAASLIVWPVTFQLALLFCSPMADWDTITAESARRSGDRRVIRTVTGWLVAGFGTLFATLVVTRLDTVYVAQVNAVPAQPANLGLAWLPLLLPMPVLWAVRGMLRGLIMSTPTSRRHLIVASVAHLLILAATAAGLGSTDLPGVAAGALAVVAGLVSEVLVLARGAHKAEGLSTAARDLP